MVGCIANFILRYLYAVILRIISKSAHLLGCLRIKLIHIKKRSSDCQIILLVSTEKSLFSVLKFVIWIRHIIPFRQFLSKPFYIFKLKKPIQSRIGYSSMSNKCPANKRFFQYE